MIKITGKIMEERMKHGWTIKQFSQSYGVSEEEFLEALKKTFSSKAYKGMLARLRKNEKIVHKSQVVSYDESNQQPETAIEELNLDSESSSEESLESLQLQKEELQNVLNSLELQHKTLTSERVQIKNRISDYKNVLLDMQAKIRQYQGKLEVLVSELDKKFASMQTINSNISETKVALSEVNSKIDVLKKVAIFIYNSGELVIESQLSVEIPEWRHLFDKILKDEVVESLTIKQIKGLSKCVVLVRFLKSQSFKYEIAFDDSNTEVCFEKILQEEYV